MNTIGSVRWAAVAALAVLAAVCAGAAEVPRDVTAARQVATKWSDAVVKVQVVVKMSMSFGGDTEKREEKTDAVGTVIDPSGLTVVSLSTMNPADMYSGMFEGGDGPQMSSEVAEVKIRISDGTEVPGKIVLRDKDLDLAFVRPAQKPAQPWPYVDLKESAPADVLDQLVTVSRLGKAANRSIAVSLLRVQSVLEKPRRFYVIGPMDMWSDVGGPVGTLDGKVVGLSLLRMAPGGGGGRYRGMGDMVIPVVLPAEDIAVVAAQAPEDAPKEAAKPAEKPAVKPAKATAPPKPAAPPKSTPAKPKPKK